MASRRSVLSVGLGVFSLVAVVFGYFWVSAGRELEASKQRALDRRAELEAEYARRAALAAESDAATSSEKTASFSPDELARIVAHPESATPTKTTREDELDESEYPITGFDHAELHRVRGHPEAWSWLLIGTHGTEASDFGPPGSVKDLLADSPASIGGYQIHGLIHRIDAGPLKGTVLVYSPPSPFSAKPSFQVGTVAFHQQSTSLIMDTLCDYGMVEGVPAHASEKFKDGCFEEVAKRLHKPEQTLFPSPWMLRDSADKNCNRSIGGTLENAPGYRYDCSWNAKTGKTTVSVKRGN